MRRKKPGLAEVSCKRIQFAPGDRVMVRMFGSASSDAIKKIKRMVKDWAGPDVEVLVYDATKMEVRIDRSGRSEGFKTDERFS